MLFNSLSFLLFLPVAFFSYWATPARYRNLILFLLSCYFYMSLIPKYILVLFFLIVLDYFLAIALEKEQDNRKVLLWVSIVANIGTLFIFKYFNFFNENIAVLADFLHWNYTPLLLSLALPLGVSFHVFQSISYIVEVYSKKLPAEKNILNYALYVLFFPQLVAGPIERPGHLLPQIRESHTFNRLAFSRGLERILFGFFKKIVIADQIAAIINPLFASPPANSFVLVAISVLFLYQLYCDFSGYTDIALGTAMLFGFSLRENFNRPFSASSVGDFWRRWHMSLSTWFRDYVFFPLGGSRVSLLKTYRNYLVVFTLSGFWHGANWTFLIWGALNGLYLIVEDFFKKIIKERSFFGGRYRYAMSLVSMFFVFICVDFSFIFFRSESTGKAWWIISNIVNVDNLHFVKSEIMGLLTSVSGGMVLYYVVFSIFVLECIQYIQEKKATFFIFTGSSIIRQFWCYFLLMSLLFFGHYGSQSFIYFQF